WANKQRHMYVFEDTAFAELLDN
nr:hypothetical protein [Tanacetum cinerariifolium]